MGTHFSRHAAALILIASSGSGVREDNMNVIVNGTAYLAVHFLPTRTIGKMRVLDPGHQTHHVAFCNWLVVHRALELCPIRQVRSDQVVALGLLLQVSQVGHLYTGHFGGISTKVVLGVALSCLGRYLCRLRLGGDNPTVSALRKGIGLGCDIVEWQFAAFHGKTA